VQGLHERPQPVLVPDDRIKGVFEDAGVREPEVRDEMRGLLKLPDVAQRDGRRPWLQARPLVRVRQEGVRLAMDAGNDGDVRHPASQLGRHVCPAAYGDEEGLAVIDGSLRRRAGRLVVAAGLVGRAAAAEAHDAGGQPGEDGLHAHDLFDAGNQLLKGQPPANGFRGLGPLGLQHGPYTHSYLTPSAAAAAPSRAAGRTPVA
jgi:hypothetical protein